MARQGQSEQEGNDDSPKLPVAQNRSHGLGSMSPRE
jgi:hypothetical protein